MKGILKKLLIIPKQLVIRPLRAIKKLIFNDLRLVIRNYEEHDGELSTCAIAFFLLISFIPASLVIISLLSFFYKSGDMVTFYLNQLKLQLPSINIERLVAILDQIVYTKRYLAFIWIPFLFWWGSLVFDIFERVLEKAFRIGESRRYWKAKIRHFLIIGGISILALSFTIISNFIAIAKNSDIISFIERNMKTVPVLHDFIIAIGHIPFLLSSISTLAVNTLLFFTLYRFVPPKKLDNKSLFQGALFASFSYEVIKSLFSYYITEINDYSSIFGPLSTIVILMIWIWYTCFLFVIGAEMAWVFFENRTVSYELDFDSGE